jgi:hypothetical protein
MIRFECPCGRQLQAAESHVGQPARCPLCDRVTVVPDRDEPAGFQRGPDDRGETERDEGDFQREREPLRPLREPPRRRDEYDEDYDHRYGRRAFGPPVTCSDANTALWMGVMGLVCCSLLAPIAMIYGIKALNQINNSEGRLTGQGQAIAGIILGAIGSALLLLYGASVLLDL